MIYIFIAIIALHVLLTVGLYWRIRDLEKQLSGSFWAEITPQIMSPNEVVDIGSLEPGNIIFKQNISAPKAAISATKVRSNKKRKTVRHAKKPAR